MNIFPLRLVPDGTDIDFMRLRRITLTIAALLLLASACLVVFKGFKYALDFTGGSLVEVRFAQPTAPDTVRARLAAAGFPEAQVQRFGSGSDLLIRLRPQRGQDAAGANERTAQEVSRALSSAANPARISRSEYVGPQVGRELAINGLYATIFVVVGFLLYIGLRFEWKFAVVASATTLFDVAVVAGWVSLTNREVDLSIVASLLSVMGFSINDKIVVFDRVRENFRSLRASPVDVMNRSINQTLSRTIITSLVFFLSVLALYLFGGATLEGLAATLMAGVVVGTLSSIFAACPLLTVGPLKVGAADLTRKAEDRAQLDRRP